MMLLDEPPEIKEASLKHMNSVLLKTGKIYINYLDLVYFVNWYGDILEVTPLSNIKETKRWYETPIRIERHIAIVGVYFKNNKLQFMYCIVSRLHDKTKSYETNENI